MSPVSLSQHFINRLAQGGIQINPGAADKKPVRKTTPTRQPTSTKKSPSRPPTGGSGGAGSQPRLSASFLQRVASARAGATASLNIPGVDTSQRQAEGIDLSHWENEFFPNLATAPIDFVILKASEGIGGKDKNYGKFYTASVEGGIPIKGAYHYLRSEWDASRQVDNFLDAVKDTQPDFYAVDVEAIGNRVDADYAQKARDFISQVEAKTSKPVVLYTNKSILGKYFDKPSDADYKLWISWPLEGEAKKQNIQDPGLDRPWGIWQKDYGAPAVNYGVKGAQGIDYNVFAGTTQDMRRWLNNPSSIDLVQTKSSVAPVSAPEVSLNSELLKASSPTSPTMSSLLSSVTGSGHGVPLPQNTGANNSGRVGYGGGAVNTKGGKSNTKISTGSVALPASSQPEKSGGGGAKKVEVNLFQKFFGIDLQSAMFVLIGILMIFAGIWITIGWVGVQAMDDPQVKASVERVKDTAIKAGGAAAAAAI
jgi:GH25 family lysozyme M1 (1,4-beta-N-acetylmuramidase)